MARKRPPDDVAISKFDILATYTLLDSLMRSCRQSHDSSTMQSVS
jgi:hypothetical protein